MAFTTVLASKPGTQSPKVDKRTDDSIRMQIDISPLLNQHELIHGEVKFTHPEEIQILEPKAILGKYIRFRVEGGPLNIPYTDYTVKFTVQTSNSNELTVPITVRAYST